VKLYQITLHTEGFGGEGLVTALKELTAEIEARDRERLFRSTPGIDNRFWGKHMTATIRQYYNYHHGRFDDEKLGKDKEARR
jgi:hypothetical protein